MLTNLHPNPLIFGSCIHNNPHVLPLENGTGFGLHMLVEQIACALLYSMHAHTHMLTG